MKRNDKIAFSDLVERIADEAKVSKNVARSLLKEMSTIIDDRLRHEGKVRISGLGIFNLKWRAAKTGRNPQTGEPNILMILKIFQRFIPKKRLFAEDCPPLSGWVC